MHTDRTFIHTFWQDYFPYFSPIVLYKKSVKSVLEVVSLSLTLRIWHGLLKILCPGKWGKRKSFRHDEKNIYELSPAVSMWRNQLSFQANYVANNRFLYKILQHLKVNIAKPGHWTFYTYDQSGRICFSWLRSSLLRNARSPSKFEYLSIPITTTSDSFRHSTKALNLEEIELDFFCLCRIWIMCCSPTVNILANSNKKKKLKKLGRNKEISIFRTLKQERNKVN